MQRWLGNAKNERRRGNFAIADPVFSRQEWLMPPKRFLDDEKRFYLGTSGIPGAGAGLFSNRKIRIGELIGVYAGDILPWGAGNDKSRDRTYFMGVEPLVEGADFTEGFIIDGKNYTKRINDASRGRAFHNFKNNAKATLCGIEVLIRATRVIRKGEEIFMAYGDQYWKEDDVFDY